MGDALLKIPRVASTSATIGLSRTLAVIGGTLLLLMPTGCIFSEGRVSGHPFLVKTNQGGKTPTPAGFYKDLDAFAVAHGFRGGPGAALDSTKLQSFAYMGGPREDLTLQGGYLNRATSVVVSLYGPDKADCQQAADHFYFDFKRQFASKYGSDAITDDLATFAKH